MRYRIIAIIAVILVVVDQITKVLVDNHMSLSESIPVTSFFSLVHVRNYGAAFGFLSNPDSVWQLWFFLVTTLIALIVIVFLAKKASPSDLLLFVALGFITGGAIGNAIDRIRLNSVIDFFDLHYNAWHWPAFNVADIGICVGATLLFIQVIKGDKLAKA